MYILPIDRILLEKLLGELEQNIKDLGEEFHDVLNQSSETWHDNAPWDAVRDKQTLLKAEYDQLKDILSSSELRAPKADANRISIGCVVELEAKRKIKSIFIAGDWSYRAGSMEYDAFVVSTQAPIAQALLNKKCGDNTVFGTITTFHVVENG